jgi:plasmid stability protein
MQLSNLIGFSHGPFVHAVLHDLEVSSNICYHDSIQVLETKMAQILVRNLDDGLKGRLQRRAKLHGQSMEAVVRDILRDALREEKAQTVGFGTASVALFSGSGIYLDEPIAEIHDMRMEIPNFEE